MLGVVIATLTGDNGLLTKAEEAQFKSEMSAYNEKVKLYTMAESIDNNQNSINAGIDGSTLQVKQIITGFNQNKYGEKVVIIRGVMYYSAPEVRLRSTQIKKEVKWCKEIGIDIYTGVVDLYDDYDEVEPLDSQWVTVNGVSYYSPDVKGLVKKIHTM